MQTIVIGHKNPDMDAIVAAIGYAHLKTALGWEEVVAARAGNTNARIDYVLERFNIEAPLFISDISPKIRDIMTRNVVSAKESSTLVNAMNSIERKQLRGLPVVDRREQCLGLLSTFKITHYLFPAEEEADTVRLVPASLQDVLSCFNATLWSGEPDHDEYEYRLMVGAMRYESLAPRLKRYQPDRVVLFSGDREDVHLLAIESGLKAVVVTGGQKPSDHVLEKAGQAGVIIASSPYDTATTLSLARGAIRVSHLIEDQLDSFSPDTPVENARRKASDSPAYVFPVVDDDGVLCGIISKSDFLKSIPRQLILVDHNEMGQAVPGAAKIPIIEVIDHHRIGGFHSDRPVLFWNNPVGSSSTIVTLCYEQNGVEIPPSIAGILMAGLISDTLNLSSPTTTEIDRRVMQKLSKIADVQPGELAEQIFAVGSPLLTMSPDEAVNADCKQYEEEGIRFSVAQIEELSFNQFHNRKKELLQALDTHREKQNLQIAFLLVTDINTQNSILLARGASWLMEDIDYPSRGPFSWWMEGVVSRKKQLLPYLLQCIQTADRRHEIPDEAKMA